MSKLLITCLALIITPIVLSQSEDLKSTAHVALSQNTSVSYASGIGPDHLLVAECAPTLKMLGLNCSLTIYHPDKSKTKCHIYSPLNKDAESFVILSVMQLSKTMLILHWREWSRKWESPPVHKIAPIDMDMCVSANSLIYPSDTTDTTVRLRDLISFENGFDVIFVGSPCEDNKSCYQSYDVNGSKIGEHRVLSDLYFILKALPVSRKTRSKGWFVYNPLATRAEVRYSVGNESKLIVNSTDRTSSNLVSHVVDERSFAICGVLASDREMIECTQYDIIENKEFKARVRLPNHFMIAEVRGLREGGVVCFTFNYDYQLIVAEMRPNRAPFIRDYPLFSTYLSGLVMGLDEMAGSFIFVQEEGHNGKHNLTLQKFSLPSHFNQGLTDKNIHLILS